jgi:hypothetical protein
VEFFETSAKEDRNIKEAFYYLAREIKEKVLVESKTPNGGASSVSGGTRISQPKEKEPKKSCC